MATDDKSRSYFDDQRPFIHDQDEHQHYSHVQPHGQEGTLTRSKTGVLFVILQALFLTFAAYTAALRDLTVEKHLIIRLTKRKTTASRKSRKSMKGGSFATELPNLPEEGNTSPTGISAVSQSDQEADLQSELSLELQLESPIDPEGALVSGSELCLLF